MQKRTDHAQASRRKVYGKRTDHSYCQFRTYMEQKRRRMVTWGHVMMHFGYLLCNAEVELDLLEQSSSPLLHSTTFVKQGFRHSRFPVVCNCLS